MKNTVKKIILGLVLAAAVFIVLNSGFFAQNIRYMFRNNTPASPAVNLAGGQAKAESDTLWISSLGIKAPVKYVEESKESVFQEALRDGVVHFPGTAMPGQPGNAYIFGHSSDYLWSKGNYKTVFALLPRINKGAEIQITDHNGDLYTYIVTDTFVVAPNDLSVLDQKNNEKKLLTLQTSYPVGTALKRYIVVAELKQ